MRDFTAFFSGGWNTAGKGHQWLGFLVDNIVNISVDYSVDNLCMISGRGTDSVCPEMFVLSVLTRNILHVIAKIPG